MVKESREVIRSIPGYSLYYATCTGEILKREGDHFFLLKKSVVHNGYYTVNIPCDNNRKHRRKVHRLVALAWIPNPKDYDIVCHKDNNPKNNDVSNLYWGTQSMNMQQMVADNRQRKSKIRNFYQIVQKMYKQGFSIKEIVLSTGISSTSVHRLIRNKNSKYGTEK